MPPHRTLGFNPQVTMDDALLVSDYMTTEGMAYEQAQNMMRDDVQSLLKALSSKSIVNVGELGALSMNINGEITFAPNPNGIDDPENFGFEPLPINTLEKCDTKNIVIPIKRRDIGKYIAAAAAIILTFLFVTPVSDKAFQKEMRASIADFATSEQISMMQQLSAPAPSQISNDTDIEICPVEYSKTENIKIETASQPLDIKTQNEDTSDNSTVIADDTEMRFYIIVASSPNEENAQLAIKELSAKMTADYTIVKCDKRHRIAINNYPTADDAQNALLQYQQTFPDAWVFSY